MYSRELSFVCNEHRQQVWLSEIRKHVLEAALSEPNPKNQSQLSGSERNSISDIRNTPTQGLCKECGISSEARHVSRVLDTRRKLRFYSVSNDNQLWYSIKWLLAHQHTSSIDSLVEFNDILTEYQYDWNSLFHGILNSLLGLMNMTKLNKHSSKCLKHFTWINQFSPYYNPEKYYHPYYVGEWTEV